MIYTKEVLEEILKEGGATVLEEYDNYIQRLRVKFRCSCGTETTKKFEMLNLYRLPYCGECSLKEKEKRKKATNIKKYGFSNSAAHPDIIKKIKERQLELYGDHPKRTKEVHEKWVETCIQRYGGHPNQNREVQAKAEFKGHHYKEYKFPSGKIIKVQGYENLALDTLITQFKEEDIVVGKAYVPTIEYVINEKRHVYFPDIYIPSENKIIEVKSEWSLKYPTHVDEKAQATVLDGYTYEIWVYNGNRKMTRKIAYTFDGEKVSLPA
jgi:hypothetical protein